MKQFYILCTFLLLSCGDLNNSSKNNKNTRDILPQASIIPVDWESISEDFNPEVSNHELDIKDVKYIDLSILGIKDNVIIEYRDKDISELEIYRVWREYSFGRIKIKNYGEKLRVDNYTGNTAYSCSKKIENRKLVALDGGCNLFVKLILPKNLEIEVYSSEKLVSKRFFPMELEELIDNMRSGFNEDKMNEIEKYLHSYKVTNKKLTLFAVDLEIILERFSNTGDDKINALRKLHLYVTDRENLLEVIENVFHFRSEREKAKRIVGV